MVETWKREGLRSFLPIFFLLVCFTVAPAKAMAGVAYNIGGIQVKFSGSNCDAYYDSSDGTLTIEVYDEVGSLQIKATSAAPYYWGEYVDIYLYAPYTDFTNLKIQGLPDFFTYVTGDVSWVKKYIHMYGYTGGTDAYGMRGLGAYYLPAGITTKWAAGIGTMLGAYNEDVASLSLQETKQKVAEAARTAGTFSVSQKIDSISRLKEAIERDKNAGGKE